MVSEDIIDYKGFNKNLTKEDLNEEELECYNKLMKGIQGASDKEKEEVTHLMEVFIETDETTLTKCVRCGKEFKDTSKLATEDNKRIYCNICLKKMWSPTD